MNLKIKIYCVLLTIAYVAIIANSMYHGSSDFQEGFKQGRQKQNFPMHLYMRVEPTDGKYSFPDKIVNTKDGKTLPATVNQYIVDYKDSNTSIPMGYKVLRLICIVLTAVLAFGLLFSPLLFFSIIYSISKNRIITKSLILRSRALGWLIVIFSIVDIIYVVNETLISRSLVELSNYNIVMGQPEYMMLVLGLVILILAEILKVSLKIKEEQDLTI